MADEDKDKGAEEERLTELAAEMGKLDSDLEEAGYPEVEVKAMSLERKFAALKEKAVEKRENEEAGKPAPLFDIDALADDVVAKMEARRRKEADLPDKPPEVTERQFTPPVPAIDPVDETKEVLPPDRKAFEACLAGGVLAEPTMDCLLHANMDNACLVFDCEPGHIEALRKWNDTLHMYGMIMGGTPGSLRYQTEIKSSRLFSQARRAIEQSSALKQAQKAMDTTDTANWIPTGFSADLHRRVRLELLVGRLFEEIVMPTATYKVPVEGTPATAYVAAENTASTSQTALTASQATDEVATFSAVRFAARTLFSDDLAEDSIIPILPYVESQVVYALADGVEEATVNGDGATAHFDTGTTWAATECHSAWNGLRHFWQTGSGDVDLGTFSTANLLKLKSKAGRYGQRPREGAWITSMVGYIKMLGLSETLTLDKYGSKATVFDGELGQYFGSPIVVSEKMKDTLNAAGIYDNSTTDNGAILYVHRPSIVMGRRSSRVESDRILEFLQTQVVATVRLSLQPMIAATNNIVTCGYNVDAA